MSIESDTQDEEFLDQIMVAILATDPQLAAIPPQPRIADDGFVRNEELSLAVQSSLTGKEIQIISSYDVTIELQRQIRGTVTQSAFRALWAKVIAKIQHPPMSGIELYSQLSHLTIDDLESGSDADADEADFTRSMTFQVFMAKA
jgi:hypothetical protein